MSIKDNIERIRQEIPPYVSLVAATKTRTVEEIREAVQAGITIIGENYVQEAAKKYEKLGKIVNGIRIEWHMLGHLQRNKVKQAIEIFDYIQSVDSFRTAREINKRCKEAGKIMPILIEINIAEEEQKYGIKRDLNTILDLIKEISQLEKVKVEGLMTMAPYSATSEDLKGYFGRMKEFFEIIKRRDISNIEMKILSMGMSSSYKIAIEKGANIVRIGTLIFGPRG